MKELVLDIAKALVDNPDAVVVEETKKGNEIILKLTVSQDDMGKAVGKQGFFLGLCQVAGAAQKKNPVFGFGSFF